MLPMPVPVASILCCRKLLPASPFVFGNGAWYTRQRLSPQAMGATDVAVALVQLARPLGFHVTVVDGRDRWANRERFPTADALCVGMPSELISAMPLTPATALVLLAHDFKYDIPVLEVALKSRVGYIGVLGSRRRASVIRDALTSMGATESELARIRIPVGLSIGARTPSEIALSVLAELVSIRSGVGSETTR